MRRQGDIPVPGVLEVVQRDALSSPEHSVARSGAPGGLTSAACF